MPGRKAARQDAFDSPPSLPLNVGKPRRRKALPNELVNLIIKQFNALNYLSCRLVSKTFKCFVDTEFFGTLNLPVTPGRHLWYEWDQADSFLRDVGALTFKCSDQEDRDAPLLAS